MSAAGLPPVLAVVGPTAVGKSDLGVALAQRLGGEVVNADSMQLYRGMDVGTAKLTEAERHGVPHHLLDVWEVTLEASVAEYQRLARETIAALRARGVVPVLVGGSGLYVRAVLDPLAFPGTDPVVRERWAAELDRVGPEALHARLAGIDPDAAAAILPSNGRRIVRALEVVELHGSFTAQLPDATDALPGPVVRIGLTSPRDLLDERIALRVDRMWEAGLVDEVRRLEADGLRQGPTASRAIGYAQVLAMFDGELDEAAARERTVTATRRFVRRQESWFRRDPAIQWHDPATVDPDALATAVAALRRDGETAS